MKLNVLRKLVRVEELGSLGERHRQAGRTLVLCHGCFDIVHPGHVRYLQFARSQGAVLVVSLTGDDAIEKSDGTRPYLPQELRAESLAALELVDHVVIADDPTAEPIIAALKPDLYVKGKEYEQSTDPRFLAEKALVESLGGRIIHGSGDVVFSSTTLIESVLPALDGSGDGLSEADRLAISCGRWGIGAGWARTSVADAFAGRRIAVVGDALLDDYTFCDATDVAGEAPILSVKPLQERRYLGGAAIVAAHLKQLGAEPHLLTTGGDDAGTEQLLERLDELGVTSTVLRTRAELPRKQRFLVDTQKLLKVDRSTEQPLDSGSIGKLVAVLAELGELDGLIFADFGQGTISEPLLRQALAAVRGRVNVVAGDVSGARRSLLAMAGVDLLTPTERELRGVMGDFEQSLPSVASRMMRQLGTANMAVTMGRRGCVMFRPREQDRREWFNARLRSDYLPSLAAHAVDPVGAGDAFLAGATLGLCCGASLPQAGYLGSATAAIAVSRMGNEPVTREQLLRWFAGRGELHAAESTPPARAVG